MHLTDIPDTALARLAQEKGAWRHVLTRRIPSDFDWLPTNLRLTCGILWKCVESKLDLTWFNFNNQFRTLRLDCCSQSQNCFKGTSKPWFPVHFRLRLSLEPIRWSQRNPEELRAFPQGILKESKHFSVALSRNSDAVPVPDTAQIRETPML
jgi:hypothetical protein